MNGNALKTLTGNPDPIPLDGPTNDLISSTPPRRNRDFVAIASGVVGAAIVLFVLALMMGVDFRRTQMTYDPAREISAKGVIQGFDEFACPASGGELGTHFNLNTGTNVYQIHVAASRLMHKHDIHFTNGQQVEVTGARVRFRGKQGILAKTITAGEQTFYFRHSDGTPLL